MTQRHRRGRENSQSGRKRGTDRVFQQYRSTSVISGNNIIVTAAHCCWDRTKNNWIGGWSFAPVYNNGSAPYGVFDWAQARVLNSWINNGDIASHVCLIALQNDSAGHR